MDSKGNFGKAYSRDMAWAASRYTEAKLDAICKELFRDIDKDTVDFVDNYDSTMKEPTLLPATFPSVLVNANTGIAVGMASNICPFNLAEVCRHHHRLDPATRRHDISATLQAPDFPGGGQILYDRAEMENIYQHRPGQRSGCAAAIPTTSRATASTSPQIPPTTTIEAIMDKVIDLVKAGQAPGDCRHPRRDRPGRPEDHHRSKARRRPGQADAEAVSAHRRWRTASPATSTCSSPGCPGCMGVRELLEEWTAFRVECVRRRIYFDLSKKQEKLHLLQGLEKILLDIDKAIRIVRETEEEAEVVPNLMIGFGIDEIQAEYVAEIKLRHLNREYILKRTQEIGELERDIAQLEGILASKAKRKGHHRQGAGGGGQEVRPAPALHDPLRRRGGGSGDRGGGARLPCAPVLHQGGVL